MRIKTYVIWFAVRVLIKPIDAQMNKDIDVNRLKINF